MGKNNTGWNLQEMQNTLVKDTENKISEGFGELANEENQQQPQTPAQPSPQEPTKGVQTYLTLTRYRQLSDIKLRRGKNATIGSLAAEAICDWLDRQQEGQQ